MKRSWAVLVGVSVFFGLAAAATAAEPVPAVAGTVAQPPGTSCNAVAGDHPRTFEIPTLYVGWLEHSNGNSWALRRTTGTGTASWPLRGLWVEVAENVTLGHGWGLALSGGVLASRHGNGSWRFDPAGQSFSFDVPSFDCWQAEGLVRRRLAGPVEVLAGVRWGRIGTRLDYSDSTTDDYVLKTTTPVIGLQVARSLARGSLLVRFLTSQFTSGTMSYHFDDHLGFTEYGDFDVKDNSYRELLASYSWKLDSGLKLGAFARWSSLEIETSAQSLSGSTHEAVSWDVDVRSWTIGGAVSWAFGPGGEHPRHRACKP